MKFSNLAIAVIISSCILGAFAQDYKKKDQEFHSSMEAALDAAGLTPYATAENDEIIAKSSEVLDEIREFMVDEFAGSWIEYDKNHKAVLVIAVTESDLSSAKKLEKIDYTIKFVTVKFSYAELDSIANKIIIDFGEFKGSGDEQLIFATAVDEKANRVVIHVRQEFINFVKERLDSAGFNLEAIKFLAQDGPVELYGALYGGTRIATGISASSLAACTAGFNVVIDKVYPGTITAAHCHIKNNNAKYAFFNDGTTGKINPGPLIGEFFAIGWPDKMDAAIFGNTNFVHDLPPRILTSPKTSQTVKPLGEYKINSSVCTYGGTSGWRCGIVRVINTRVHMGGGTYMNMPQADFCGAPGDSGGPVVTASGNAIGIFSGGLGGGPNGTCGPVFGGVSRPNAIFQPLAPYLAKYSNVKLATQ
jgi:streptogrisin C